MAVTVSKWGSSLGVRLPAKIAETMGIQAGDDLDIFAKVNGEIVLRKARRQRPSLDELLARVPKGWKPEGEFPWGGPVGREIL